MTAGRGRSRRWVVASKENRTSDGRVTRRGYKLPGSCGVFATRELPDDADRAADVDVRIDGVTGGEIPILPLPDTTTYKSKGAFNEWLN